MNSCHVLPEICILVNACVSDGPVLDNLYVYVCVFACVQGSCLACVSIMHVQVFDVIIDTRMTILAQTQHVR